MTWIQLLAVVNNLGTSQAQLVAIINALGLPTGGNANQLRDRLRLHIAAQPDLTVAVPPAVATAATAPPAPAPAPAAAPVAPVGIYPAWLPAGGLLVGTAALIAAIVFGIWLLRQPAPVQTVAAGQAQQPAPQLVTVDVNIRESIASVPSTSPAQPSSTGAIVIDTLNDGRSYDSRSTLPLAELGFPPYEDTGIGKHRVWNNLAIPDGWTLIAMGVKVNGSDRGNINAYKGPTTVSLDIIDGAYVVKPNNQALGEFCERWTQHKANGWLSQHLRPLEEWGNRPCS